MAFLITFTCYGSHLHGAEPGSVDRNHNRVGGRSVSPDIGLVARTQARMRQREYRLDEFRRRTVLGAIRQVCLYKNWTLIAVHVRTNHAHAVVDADIAPEAMMQTFKSHASRLLNKSEASGTKRWTRHGSTRYLWTRDSVEAAVRYVVESQGEAMAVFLGTAP
ncbi:MAG: transposase [Bryobacteraceae bacterium]